MGSPVSLIWLLMNNLSSIKSVVTEKKSFRSSHFGFPIDKKWRLCKGPTNDYSCSVWVNHKSIFQKNILFITTENIYQYLYNTIIETIQASLISNCSVVSMKIIFQNIFVLAIQQIILPRCIVKLSSMVTVFSDLSPSSASGKVVLIFLILPLKNYIIMIYVLWSVILFTR